MGKTALPWQHSHGSMAQQCLDGGIRAAMQGQQCQDDGTMVTGRWDNGIRKATSGQQRQEGCIMTERWRHLDGHIMTAGHQTLDGGINMVVALG